MKKYAILMSLVATLSLTGCKWFATDTVDMDDDGDATEETTTNDSAIEASAQSASSAVAAQSSSMLTAEQVIDIEMQGMYDLYSPEVLMDGQTKVLFFHAAWCPVCKAADSKLMTWYATATPGRSVYKVDYDANADLKAKYGVTYQHTYVLVDGEGNLIQKIQGPTDDELKEMIGA